MQAAYPDILNELADVEIEVARLAASLARKPDLSGLDEIGLWERTHLLASAVEKTYTGCERVMARITTDIDGTRVAHSDGWHVTLLKRMSRPIEGRDGRGPVIGAETYEKLDRLRSFRHRERNSYGIELDPEIVLERAKEAVQSFALFRDDVKGFMVRLASPFPKEQPIL